MKVKIKLYERNYSSTLRFIKIKIILSFNVLTLSCFVTKFQKNRDPIILILIKLYDFFTALKKRGCTLTKGLCMCAKYTSTQKTSDQPERKSHTEAHIGKERLRSHTQTLLRVCIQQSCLNLCVGDFSRQYPREPNTHTSVTYIPTATQVLFILNL